MPVFYILLIICTFLSNSAELDLLEQQQQFPPALLDITDELMNITTALLNGTAAGNWSTLNMTDEFKFNMTVMALNDSDRPTFPPILVTTTQAPRSIPVARMLYNDSKVDEPWRIRMVYNLRWDLSKNFLAVSYLNLESQSMLDREKGDGSRVDVIGPHYYPLSRMSFFYGIDQPNMLIRFNQTSNGAAFCQFGRVKDSFVHINQSQLDDWKWKNCRYKREAIYTNEIEEKKQKNRFYAFCPIHNTENGSEPYEWRIADGKFNRPSRTPHCLYDFYEKAKEPEEYHLLKYCAKAYFFNGLDHNFPDKRLKNRRRNWLLYLAEGQLKCSISGNVQTDLDLVARGYSVELVQYSIAERIMNYKMKKCSLKATLVSYKDDKHDGKFFIAAVVGSAQLDGEFRWPYARQGARFWDKETYTEKFKYMNYDDKACYIFYEAFLRDFQTNRYELELKVSHFCTKRGMRGILKFNVSIGPNQVPDEGIYEDTGIQINLNEYKMLRSTGQFVNAKQLQKTPQIHEVADPYNEEKRDGVLGWFDKNLPGFFPPGLTKEPTPHYVIEGDDAENIVPVKGNCTRNYQCEFGLRCGYPGSQYYCNKMGPDELGETNLLGKRVNYDSGPLSGCVIEAGQIELQNADVLNFPQMPSNLLENKQCQLMNNEEKREGNGPDRRRVGCKRDYHCRVDEYCAYSIGECRNVMFLMPGEMCYFDADCFPDAFCILPAKGLKYWGICKIVGEEYNQNAKEPNEPLD